MEDVLASAHTSMLRANYGTINTNLWFEAGYTVDAKRARDKSEENWQNYWEKLYCEWKTPRLCWYDESNKESDSIYEESQQQDGDYDHTVKQTVGESDAAEILDAEWRHSSDDTGSTAKTSLALYPGRMLASQLITVGQRAESHRR